MPKAELIKKLKAMEKEDMPYQDDWEDGYNSGYNSALEDAIELLQA